MLTSWLGDGAQPRQPRRHVRRARHRRRFETPAEAVEGFMQLVRYARAQDELMRTPPSLPEDCAFDARGGQRIMQRRARAPGAPCCPRSRRRGCWRAYGIPVVPTAIARDPRRGRRSLAAALIAQHGACVVKILSDDISHKSDVGGVRLGLEQRRGGARCGGRKCCERIARLMPEARIKGFTVQPMIRAPACARADHRHVGRSRRSGR